MVKKNCGQALAAPVALNVPRGDSRAWGGFRRKEPVGCCAKGMPLKLSTLPELPTIVAEGEEIVTVGESLLAGAASAVGRDKRKSKVVLRIMLVALISIYRGREERSFYRCIPV